MGDSPGDGCHGLRLPRFCSEGGRRGRAAVATPREAGQARRQGVAEKKISWGRERWRVGPLSAQGTGRSTCGIPKTPVETSRADELGTARYTWSTPSCTNIASDKYRKLSHTGTAYGADTLNEHGTWKASGVGFQKARHRSRYGDIDCKMKHNPEARGERKKRPTAREHGTYDTSRVLLRINSSEVLQAFHVRRLLNPLA